MTGINAVAVLAAAFVVGGLWYSPLLFGNAYLRLRGIDPNAGGSTMGAGEIAAEFARWLVVTAVLARRMAMLGITTIAAALAFGSWMWVALYAALAGSVLHEGTPWRLYAIHAGDGLAKITLATIILARWRAR